MTEYETIDEARNAEKPWRDEELMRELYHDRRMSQQDIAEHFDNRITQAGVGYCLDQLGIEKRDRSEAAKLRCQKNTMTQEKIEQLHSFVEDTRETAEKVEAGGYVNQDHANGVACGLRWAADELESILNEDGGEEYTFSPDEIPDAERY